MNLQRRGISVRWHYMRNFKQKGLSPSEIWQLGGWYLSGIWQLKVIFYPKYGSLLEKVITFEANIKAYV